MKQILKSKNNFWLFTCVLILCFAFSAGVRFQQFEAWKKAPAAFFVGERPLMTTLDAPYWLRWAREYNEGIFIEKGVLRGYPENTEEFNKHLIVYDVFYYYYVRENYVN